jgi:hypothetical protein
LVQVFMGYSKGIPVDVVIDIETVALMPTEAEIEEWKANWKPKGNAKKEETIEKQREAAFADPVKAIVEERQFSLGGKRMISCALGVASKAGRGVANITSWASDDLTTVCKGVVNYLNEFKEYNLVGWNLRSFDLPELAKSFHQTGLQPQNKPSKWGIIDLCAFPFDRKSLKDTAKAFGFPLSDVSAVDVAALHADKQWDKIKEYNEHDVRLTGQIYVAASTIFTF